jgi:hypothetical protein
MKRQSVFKILTLSFVTLCSFAAHADSSATSCVSADPSCKATLDINAAGKLEFYRNYDLATDNSSITKLVVMSHGVGRNFGLAFARMMVVYSSPSDSTSTLIVAPHFQADLDKPAPGFLYWSVNGWASGNDSLDPSHLSSYDAVDSLITQIASGGHFPNLREIIVTGLSAGGQLTDRFAAGSSVENLFPNIHFRYVIASPSSYLYFDENRWVPGTSFKFAPPSNPACVFNSYRYGLDGRNRYMSKKSANQIIADFRSRDIVIMVGDQDDATAAPNPPIPADPKDGADLDVSCAGELEGPSRLERAQVFKAYLDFSFPEAQHPLIIGTGIAHQLRLYSSPNAQPWL